MIDFHIFANFAEKFNNQKSQTMKKLMLLAGALCFIFASCCNEPKEQAAPAEGEGCQKENPECQMPEEVKQAIADWENWDNLEPARQEELLAKKKECYDKCKAEREEKAAKMAEIDAKMANWDNMTIAEKKAVFDEMPCCPKKPCCGKKPCCDKKPEGCCKDKKE